MSDRESNGRFSKGNKLGNRFTKGSQTEIARKGQEASAAAKRERRTFRECLAIAMEEKNPKKRNKTNRELTMESLTRQCVDGDLRAIHLAAELTGELKTQLEISTPPRVEYYPE